MIIDNINNIVVRRVNRVRKRRDVGNTVLPTLFHPLETFL